MNPESNDGSRYRYNPIFSFAKYVAGIFMAIMAWMGPGILLKDLSHYLWTGFFTIGFASILMQSYGIYYLYSGFIRSRPIIVNQERISAMVGTWTWRSINWNEIEKIHKIRRLNRNKERLENNLRIIGPNCWIYIDDSIHGFDELVKKINDAAEQRKIPLILCDRSIYREYLKAHKLSRLERRAIIREGVKSAIDSL